jgi:hypothetical protein
MPERAQVEDIWNGIMRDPGQIYLGAFIGDDLVAACNAAVVPNLTRGARPYVTGLVIRKWRLSVSLCRP